MNQRRNGIEQRENKPSLCHTPLEIKVSGPGVAMVTRCPLRAGALCVRAHRLNIYELVRCTGNFTGTAQVSQMGSKAAASLFGSDPRMNH